MLAVAVGTAGVWPETRTQAFDMACRTLLAEHNEEHRIASPDPGGITDLIEASGKLCAVQLLTGAAGYALPGAESDQHFLGLDRLQGTDREILSRSLESKLFESPTERRTVPVHRQVAEFLAARYLAALVESGLPVGRILALITGYDGVVVSELRGLSAWLAAHSKSSRAEVIARDPLGTVLYGDAEHFSPEEKRLLLDGIERQTAANPRLITTDPAGFTARRPCLLRHGEPRPRNPDRSRAGGLVAILHRYPARGPPAWRATSRRSPIR